MAVDLIIRFIGSRFNALIFPVTITALCVVWTVNNLSYIFVDQPEEIKFSRRYKTNSLEVLSISASLVSILATMLVLIFLITIATLITIILFKYNYSGVLFLWLALSLISLFFLQSYVIFDLLFTYWQAPRDMISFTILLYNIGVGGLISLFYIVHPVFRQIYCMFAAMLVTWLLLMLPIWMIWAILIGMSLYDIFAVLPKFGPLQLLIRETNYQKKPLPGFIYDSSCEFTEIIDGETNSDRHIEKETMKTVSETGKVNYTIENKCKPREVYKMKQKELVCSHQEGNNSLFILPQPNSRRWNYEHELQVIHPFKLGLGDFIFYSLLIGYASEKGVAPLIFCQVNILVGMIITFTILLSKHRLIKALPALPIPLFISMFILFLYTCSVSVYTNISNKYNLIL